MTTGIHASHLRIELAISLRGRARAPKELKWAMVSRPSASARYALGCSDTGAGGPRALGAFVVEDTTTKFPERNCRSNLQRLQLLEFSTYGRSAAQDMRLSELRLHCDLLGMVKALMQFPRISWGPSGPSAQMAGSPPRGHSLRSLHSPYSFPFVAGFSYSRSIRYQVVGNY
jgi:hypothetical protein